MTWYAFAGLNGGKAIDLAGSQETQATIEGFHGYATQAQAQAHPNSVNLITRPLADVWIADYNAAVKEGAQPGGPNNILTPGGAAGAVGSTVPGLSDIGAFFSTLAQAATWTRVAKVVVGGALLIIGISHLTGADNAVANAARKVPVIV
jgi:hypothetical protein